MITVDLHSHILPGIDDGSPDTDESVKLLREEAVQGIRHIVLTPHFMPEDESVESFIQRRDAAYELFLEAVGRSMPESNFDFRPAAEIHYSSKLATLESLDGLCISGTKVLLIEFSSRHHPEFAKDVLYQIQLRGYIPLLAHVERFHWLRKDPYFLFELVENGSFAQFNADLMTQDRGTLQFVRQMLENGLLHGIGSDTHNMEERPPRIAIAEKLLAENPGNDIIEEINVFSETLLNGDYPNTVMPIRPKKHFWDFFRK